MVRLLVRKSLLSAWTSARLYGRRPATHGATHGAERCSRRRTVAAGAVVAAGNANDGCDIRLDVLFFSCCCSGDDVTSCCCCCCMTDECQGKLPATSFSSMFYCFFDSYWMLHSDAKKKYCISLFHSLCLCLSLFILFLSSLINTRR